MDSLKQGSWKADAWDEYKPFFVWLVVFLCPPWVYRRFTTHSGKRMQWQERRRRDSATILEIHRNAVALGGLVSQWSDVKCDMFRGWVVWMVQPSVYLLHLEFSPRIVVCIVAVLETEPVPHLFSYLIISVLVFQASVLLFYTNFDMLSFKFKFLQIPTQPAAI